MTFRTVVPPFLLERLADHHTAARATLLADIEMRAERGTAVPERTTITAPRGGSLTRSIYDAKSSRTLPGTLVRKEGGAATGDAAADEAYDGLGSTYEFFDSAYGFSSLDGYGLPLDATVHYAENYDNAFWDGTRMVFGDGDGEIFTRFTVSVGVIAHELAHGFTQYNSPLTYQGQSGALNESISDVFGAMVEQFAAGQTAQSATWLIGEGLFLPAVEGRALRSLIEPGTAYDDDVLGKDPQPAHMDSFVVTDEDDGGVHINSGIPNRAFAVAARALGGSSWTRAGQVWFDVVTTGGLAENIDFAGFSRVTLNKAAERFGDGSDVHRAVRRGWDTVGVVPAESPSQRV